MADQETYRLRATASGREAVAPVDPDAVYVDAVTGEEMEPVARVLPLAGSSPSRLLRTPENLRLCSRCDQMLGVDVADCPYCGKRQDPLGQPA
jgi:hypothetical protein